MRSNWKRFAVAIAVAALIAALTVPSASAGAPPDGPIVDVIVLLDHTPTAADDAQVRRLGGQVGLRLENINVLSLSLPESALAALSRSPGVLSVERARDDIAYHDHATDPGDELQWGTNRVDAEIAHGVGHKGGGVVVAVVDTGIDPDHAEFENRIDGRAMSFAGRNPSTDVTDKNGHGTHTAGIVGAADDGTGVVGVAPDATILPIQVSRGSRIKDEAILAAFNYLAGLENPVDVVNMSFGSSQPSAAEASALQALADQGATLVASAGNSSGGPVGYPAGYGHVIAVSSTTVDDTLSGFSSVGLGDNDLAAPGSNILSTSNDGGYVHMSGTSMSAPHVAGAAAVVIGAEWTDARARLTTTAEGIGLSTEQMGAGLLDVAAAVGQFSGNDLGNVPPVVDAGADQTVVLPADVQLSGTVSDANGDSLGVSWTVTAAPAASSDYSAGDPISSSAQTTFSPDAAGTYTLELSATELNALEGYSVSDSVVITALAAGTSVEDYGVTAIAVTRTTQGRWQNVDFLVTIATESGAPVEGASVTVSISRPGRVFDDMVGTTNSAGQASFRIRRAVAETYSILLRDVSHPDPLLAWDGVQASASEGADYPPGN
jgi:subtilisin